MYRSIHLHNIVVDHTAAFQRHDLLFVGVDNGKSVGVTQRDTVSSLVIVGNGLDFARKICDKIEENGLKRPKLSEFKHFGTAMFRFENAEIEWVGARKESYDESSRKPAVENGTLQDDQNRRDFTINALAISLQDHNYGELLDPFDGLEDMENQIIRTPLDPDITFSDDPLRMLRAIRFATQLFFDIETETFEAIQRNAQRVHILSQESMIL